jgi:RNA polymerase sigma factor (sigma-70 family)
MYQKLEYYSNQIEKYKVFTPEEEKEVVKKMISFRNKTDDESKKQNLYWREKLITHNLKWGVILARKMSKRYKIPLSDAVGYINEGFCRAADKYKLEKNAKFITYAYWACLMVIQRAILKKGAKVSVGRYSKLIRFKCLLGDLETNRNGKRIALNEMSELTSYSDKEIKERLEDIHYFNPINTISLDANVKTNGMDIPTTVLDTLGDNRYPVDREYELELIRNTTNKILENRFCPLDHKIIIGRFGLDGKKAKTLVEMAAELGVSTETVRVREKKVLAKLKTIPEMKSLRY